MSRRESVGCPAGASTRTEKEKREAHSHEMGAMVLKHDRRRNGRATRASTPELYLILETAASRTTPWTCRAPRRTHVAECVLATHTLRDRTHRTSAGLPDPERNDAGDECAREQSRAIINRHDCASVGEQRCASCVESRTEARRHDQISRHRDFLLFSRFFGGALSLTLPKTAVANGQSGCRGGSRRRRLESEMPSLPVRGLRSATRPWLSLRKLAEASRTSGRFNALVS